MRPSTLSLAKSSEFRKSSPSTQQLMAIKILAGIVALIVLFFIIVAMRPADFRIVRRGSVAAPASVVFAQVNDFRRWQAWSPWASLDPQMKQTYEGAAEGRGAIYTWTGNGQVGQGRMEITESRSPELIRIHLEFFKPFAGVCPTEFTFVPEGTNTVVTWTMTGRHTFIPKAIGLFLNMDKMIGSQFDTGLAQLKTVAENSSQLSTSAN